MQVTTTNTKHLSRNLALHKVTLKQKQKTKSHVKKKYRDRSLSYIVRFYLKRPNINKYLLIIRNFDAGQIFGHIKKLLPRSQEQNHIPTVRQYAEGKTLEHSAQKVCLNQIPYLWAQETQQKRRRKGLKAGEEDGYQGHRSLNQQDQ